MTREDLDFGCSILLLAVGTVLGFILLLFVIGYVMERMSLPADLAQIEQLRSDSRNLDPSQAEDVIGQITVWNQTIRQKQAFNDQWWAAIIIPDEWDDVALIPVPRQP